MNQEAKNILSKDKVFLKIMEECQPLFLPRAGNVFNELIKGIIYQLISYKAADTIYGRLLALIGKETYTPDEFLKMSIASLRQIGCSPQKAQYCINVALFFKSKKLYHYDWSILSDEAIIKLLTEIKGIGEWTAQMILIFELQRPDVFPVKDLAIQNAMKASYPLSTDKKMLKTEMILIAESWKPFRTLASLYLWSWIRENQ